MQGAAGKVARGHRGFANGAAGSAAVAGAVYDLLEQMGHGPLEWSEALGARMPSPRETERLALPRGVPLLHITRTTSSPAGTVLEVNDTRMSAEAFEIGYTLTRHPTAAPAT
jgi:GntR family transcriptional regulator